MGATENLATIQAVYEAFGRGDVAAICAVVTDDVDWSSEAVGDGGPWFGPHRGPDGVVAFFTALAESCEVQEFTPLVMTATDDDVLTVVRYRARVRATGKEAAMEIHHWFHFEDGKIARYRGTEDTAQTAEAFQAD